MIDEQQLFERFHAALDVESKPGAYDRMRTELARSSVRPRKWPWLELPWPRTSARLAAGVMVIALALAAGAVFLGTHHQFGPTPGLIPHIQIRAPGASVCIANPTPVCGVGQPLFVSANVGWLTANLTPDTSSSACNPVCPTTSVVFRTDDGGFHWTPQLSWYGSGPDVIRASTDGMEGLALGTNNKNRSVLFHTTDGGAHWTRFGLPPSAGQAVQTVCKFGAPPCIQQTIAVQVYFLNPREGWVLSQEATFAIADLFHTTDSGAHWNLTRIDIKAAFNLDLAKGLADPNGRVDHSLYGRLVFGDSSTGLLVPQTGWDIYVTHDGGSTWRVQSLPKPIGIHSDVSAFPDSVRLFSNGKDGVVSLQVRSPGQVGPLSAQSDPYQYVSSTSDGGDHWSNPTHLPSVVMPSHGGVPAGSYFVYVTIDFIDPTDWAGWPEAPWDTPTQAVGGLMHTSDAGQHWDVIPGSVPPNFSGSFEFLDSSHGWAYVSDSSGTSLYRTTDGGVDWTPLSLPELGFPGK